MMEKIEEPVAEGVVRWLTAEEGGRNSGPPTAPVYMATSVFVLGGDADLQPGWPASATQLSILLEQVELLEDGRSRCLVGFLVPDLARPNLHAGTEILVLEGPKTVASVQIVDVFS